MELLSLITKNAHSSSLNSLRSNSFCDSIYKLLDFDVLNDVAKSLTFMTNIRYLYTGKIVYNKDSKEIEVYYKGSDSSEPIYLIISPDESKNNNGLKFNGLSDEIMKALKIDKKPEIIQKTEVKVEIIPEIEQKSEKIPENTPKTIISENVDLVLNNIDALIEKELENPNKNLVSLVLNNIDSPIPEITKPSNTPIIEKSETVKVETIMTGIDQFIKHDENNKKVSEIVSGLDKIIEHEQKEFKIEESKRKTRKKVKIVNKLLDSIIEKS